MDANHSFEYKGGLTPAQTNLDMVINCESGFTRRIDALLLSIGGNDTGFSRVIRHSLANGIERVASAAGGQPTLSPAKAIGIVNSEQKFKRPFEALNKTFRRELKITNPSKVIFLGYPDPFVTERFELCHSGRGLRFLDVIPIIPPFVSRTETLAMMKYQRALNKRIKSLVTKKPFGWTYVDDHVEDFHSHGWCAANENGSPETDVDAYDVTQRWMRTPEDGARFQNRQPAQRKKESRIATRLLTSYGAFHPNGLGAAAMADAYLRKMVNLFHPQ